MNIVAVCALAVVAVVIAVSIRAKNAEISLLLCAAAGVMILLSAVSEISSVISAVNSVIAASGISANHIAILLKVIGICLLSELAAGVCRDAGQQGIASNVLLAGKILAASVSLPLYTEILDVIMSLSKAA